MTFHFGPGVHCLQSLSSLRGENKMAAVLLSSSTNQVAMREGSMTEWREERNNLHEELKELEVREYKLLKVGCHGCCKRSTEKMKEMEVVGLTSQSCRVNFGVL